MVPGYCAFTAGHAIRPAAHSAPAGGFSERPRGQPLGSLIESWAEYTQTHIESLEDWECRRGVLVERDPSFDVDPGRRFVGEAMAAHLDQCMDGRHCRIEVGTSK